MGVDYSAQEYFRQISVYNRETDPRKREVLRKGTLTILSISTRNPHVKARLARIIHHQTEAA